MSDTYYSISSVGKAYDYTTSNVTVGASATTANPIEVRITDGTATAEQVYEYLERLADYFATKNPNVVAAGTLTG